MAKGTKGIDQQGSETPTEFPSVPPRDLYPTSDIRFVMVEVGKLTEAVNTLKETLKETKTTVDWLKYIIALATGAIIVIGYIADKRMDQIFSVLTKAEQSEKTTTSPNSKHGK